MPEQVNRELGELSTKIDGLTTLITQSHTTTNDAIELNRQESSKRHDRLHKEYKETTAALGTLRVDHESLKTDHKAKVDENNRRFALVWRVLTVAGVLGGGGFGIFKVVT